MKKIHRDCPGIRTNMGIMCLSSSTAGFPIVHTDRFNGNGNGQIHKNKQTKKSDKCSNKAKLKLVC